MASFMEENMIIASEGKQTLASLKGIESQLSVFALHSRE
jgi:hypothetical protein